MFSFLRTGARRPAASRAVRLGVEGCEERNPAATIYALSDNRLLRFDSAAPAVILGTVDIRGLNAGEQVVGIDFRPRTGQLFGLVVDATTGALNTQTITVDPLTGATRRVGGPVSVTSPPPGGGYGFDFDPTADRIRVVNTENVNLRIDPNTGARADAPADAPLNPLRPFVKGAAYDRNFDGRLGPAGTTLYALALPGGPPSLVTQGGVNQTPSPNGGSVANVVGPLRTGFDSGQGVGFDITAGGAAFAAYGTAGGFRGSPTSTGFYTIDLATGAAALVGPVGNGGRQVQGVAAVPDGTRVVGLNGGPGAATVRVQDAFTNADRFPSITPFAGYRGAVSVGAADFNRDGVPDAMVAAQGAGGAVKVFDGATGAELLSVAAFQGFRGSVTVAGGDVNGDGFHDLIIGANGANGAVKAFSGQNGQVVASFLAYRGYRGAVSVGAADFDNDGTDSIIVGAGARGTNGFVATFDRTGRADGGGFGAFARFDGPISVAGGDVDGDGTPDVIVGAGAGRGGAVRAFSGAAGNALLTSFAAFGRGYVGGVSVGTADVNQDGRYEIEAAPLLGRSAEVRSFDGATGAVVGTFTAGGRGAAVAGQRF